MDIVEKFLKEKLDAAIEGGATSNSLSMMYDIPKECGEARDMIKKKMPEDGGSVDSILKEKLYYLNNIMTEWRTLLKKDNQCTPVTVRLAKGLQERVRNIKKELQESDKRESVKNIKKEVQESAKHEQNLEVYRWSSRSVNPEKIYGVEDKSKITERLLLKDGFKAIGFVGMSGVGKTALCQKAFSNQQVKKHFSPRIWVCLSKQPNVKDYSNEMVRMMLTCLGYEKKIVDKVEGEGGLKMLILALQRQLKRQRYLIVLDDATTIRNFCSSLAQDNKNEDQLAYGLPKGSQGALLITSRSRTTMEDMIGEKNFHSLPLADKKSCWKIFKDAINKDGDALTEDIKKLKNEIVKECAGLPLMAKMLGQIVRSHPQEETQKQEA